jgi:hypothetical protein
MKREKGWEADSTEISASSWECFRERYGVSSAASKTEKWYAESNSRTRRRCCEAESFANWPHT